VSKDVNDEAFYVVETMHTGRFFKGF